MPIFATKPRILGQPWPPVYSTNQHPLQVVKQVDNDKGIFHGSRTSGSISNGMPSVLADQEGVQITELPGDETGRRGLLITVPPSKVVTTLVVRLPKSSDKGEKNGADLSPIRRKSKAFNAKLQEGDEVLTVNGHNVRNTARDIAMGYVDEAMDTLDLELVRRGTGAPAIPINASSTQHVNGNTEIRRIPTYQITTKQPGLGHNKQTSTTTHVQTRTDGGVTEESTDSTGLGRYGKGETVTFRVPKLNVAAKPAIWSPPDQSQTAKKTPLAYSSSTPSHTTTAHVQYGGGAKHDSAPSAPQPKVRTPFLESRQQEHAPAKPMRWEPQIHVSTTPKMEPDSSTTTWSGCVSGPRRTSIGKEVTITFAPPGFSQGLTAKRISVDSGIAPSPITPVEEEPARVSKTVDVQRQPVRHKEEPTVILRRAAPPSDRPDSKGTQDEPEIKRPYSYPGKHSEDDPEITTEMRMKACKTIADLLMFPADKHAKGARMFAKRRKRSDRWSVEGMGQKPDEEEEEEEETKDRGVEITLVASGRKPLPPGAVPIGMPLPPPPPPPPPSESGAPVIPPPPPPPPPGTKYRLKVEPTNFKVNLKKKDICEHNIVSPEQMGRLVVDLKAASGRGANMFERRRQRSDQFVIDETKVKPPPVLKKPTKPAGVASASIKMKQDGAVPLQKKSPWEAAMESPSGSCDAAFGHIKPKRPSLTQVDSITKQHPPPPQTKPKPQAARMATSKMVPEMPSKALSEQPKLRPKFTVSDPKFVPPPAAETGSPIFKPKFTAKRVSSDSGHGSAKPLDFNPKPRGWGSPVHSGETSPTSQTSMNSAEDGRFGSAFPTGPVKYGGTDFNRKPRGWASPHDPTANAATNGRPATYHYGPRPAQYGVHPGLVETGDL